MCLQPANLSQKGPPHAPWTMFSPPVPYHLGNGMAVGILDNGNLNGITLEGFREGFCATPILVRKMLGEPTITARGPSYLFFRYDRGRYAIIVHAASNDKRIYREDLKRKNTVETLSDPSAIEAALSLFREICITDLSISCW